MEDSICQYKAVFLYGENKAKIENEINFFRKSNNNFHKFDNKIINENIGLLIDKICAKNLFSEQEIILIENINSKQLSLILEILEKYIEQSENLLIVTLEENINYIQLPQNNPQILNLLCTNEHKDEKFEIINNLIVQYKLNLNAKQKSFLSKILHKENIFFIEQEIKKLSLLAYGKETISNSEIIHSLDLKPNYYINNIIENILAKNNNWYTNLNLLKKQYQPLIILKVITSSFIKQKYKNISNLQIAKILKISLEYELQIKIDNQRGEALITKFLYDLQASLFSIN